MWCPVEDSSPVSPLHTSRPDSFAWPWRWSHCDCGHVSVLRRTAVATLSLIHSPPSPDSGLPMARSLGEVCVCVCARLFWQVVHHGNTYQCDGCSFFELFIVFTEGKKQSDHKDAKRDEICLQMFFLITFFFYVYPRHTHFSVMTLRKCVLVLTFIVI